MLSDTQVNDFAERGYIVVPQVVPGDILDKAAQRIDEVTAADPPAEGIGGNYASEQTRRALYFRISNIDHAAHRSQFLQDSWLEYEPIRSQPVG